MSELDLEELSSLSMEIEKLRQTAHLLSHRVDTIQNALEQHSLPIEGFVVKVAATTKAKHVKAFLEELQLKEEGLTIGEFLKSLNKYLINNSLVDYNDLQIHMTPILQKVFQKPSGLKKVPYSLLLLALPKIFI